jgi:uncharacterized protein YndB with AHSA1/START domain
VHFEHSLDIAAPAAAAWAHFATPSLGPTWSPTFKSCQVLDKDELKPGNRFVIDVDGAGESTFTVTQVVEGRSFAWESKTRGVHFVADHIVEPTGGSSCRVTLVADFSGWPARLFRGRISRVTRRNLPLEAGGLKQAAERAATTAAL